MAYQRWRRRVHADVTVFATESSDDEVKTIVEGEVLAAQECLSDNATEYDAGAGNIDMPPLENDGYDSDYGYTRYVLSSDDDDDGDHDGGIADNPDLHPPAEPTLSEELAAWAIKHKCTRTAIDELLDIWRRQGHELPKDARTLLKTPRQVATVATCGGQYAYFGIRNQVLQILEKKSPLHPDILNSIELIVNIDGVPLFKSSTVQFWPILCSFHKPTLQPFVVAIFCGNGKPNSVKEYLGEFLQELTELRDTGIVHNGQRYQLTVKAFVCDAPSRSFVKCTKLHSGYYACERCVIKGSWNGRVVLDDTERHPARTEEKFNQVDYPGHQLGRSPLIDAGIPCIGLFSLDYMHLVCLGVVKRMLVFLRQGPAVCKLSFQQRSQISGNLMSLRGKLPSDFARQPRSLLELDRWKATEFRQFLLYTGSVVLKGILSREMYTHFLTLSVALSIMLQSDAQRRNGYLNYAKQLLLYFVNKSQEFYGDTFTVYNVHNLIHLPDDVEFFKCSLNDVSAFQFENHLQTIKRFVRNSQNPIAQVAKRLAELDNSAYKSAGKESFTPISTRTRDMCFMLQDEQFAFVKEKRPDGTFVCDVLSLRNMDNFFEHPCKSKLLNIAFVNNLQHGTKRRLLQKQNFSHKVICLPYNRGYVLFPMLHAIET